MESILAWIFAAIVAAQGVLVFLILQRRSEQRIRELMDENSRERAQQRELASMLATERTARLEAQALAVAFREERDRLVMESDVRYRRVGDALEYVSKQVDSLSMPEVLARMTERTASLVLMRMPDKADRDLMALAASFGGLVTAHSYISMAMEAQMKKLDAIGGFGTVPIYTVAKMADEADDTEAGDFDDEPPSSSGSIN